MTKPFEPVDQVLYHIADEYLDEDWYMSAGKYRRIWYEDNRKNSLSNRKSLKLIRVMLKRMGMVAPSIQASRAAQKRSY